MEKKNLVIRPFYESDLDICKSIIVDAYKSKYTKLLSFEDSNLVELMHLVSVIKTIPFKGYYVAVVDGEIVGLLILRWKNQKTRKTNFLYYFKALQVGLWKSIRIWAGLRILHNKPAGNECYIELVAVGSEYRNQGVGTALLKYARNIASIRGLRLLTINVASSNPAIHLYKRVGFFISSKSKSLILKKVFNISCWLKMRMELR